MEDDDIKGAVILRVTLLTLKYIFRPELRGKLREIFRLLRELSDKRTGLEYLETLLRYLVHATDEVKEEDLKEAVNEIDISEAIKSVESIEEIRKTYKM